MTQPETVEALVIAPDASYEVRTLPTGYPHFAESFLGGDEPYLEILTPASGIVFWFDENGKLKGLEPNPLATRLFHALGTKRLMLGDVIAGPVAVTGTNGEFETDCPDEVMQVLNRIEERR